MPLLRSNTADKIIVDRRKPHRNSDVARAVRRTRDQLTHRPGNPTFDRELLKLHARATARVALAVGALIGSAAPLTEAERDALGPVADRALDTGAELAERGAREVERRAEALH